MTGDISKLVQKFRRHSKRENAPAAIDAARCKARLKTPQLMLMVPNEINDIKSTNDLIDRLAYFTCKLEAKVNSLDKIVQGMTSMHHKQRSYRCNMLEKINDEVWATSHLIEPSIDETIGYLQLKIHQRQNIRIMRDISNFESTVQASKKTKNQALLGGKLSKKFNENR